LKKGKGQVFYKLGSQFPVTAVVGLGKDGAGYNEEEDIDEGQENVRIGAAGMLSVTSSKLLHYFGYLQVREPG
jgi:aminopeptidase